MHNRIGTTWLEPAVPGCSWGELPIYAEKGERQVKIDQRIHDLIEQAVAGAYDLGHAHGMNVHRLYMRLPPQRVDEGWGQFVDTFVKYVQEEDANARDPGRDSNDV